MNKIIIVCGSQRKNSQSLKVSNYIENRLNEKSGKNCDVAAINLINEELHLWDEDFPDSSEKWGKNWTPVGEKLSTADALIIVSPEWGGMVPPILKNFFLLCGEKELGHKPALIVSLTSGLLGGSYPVSELRSSSYKNNKLCFLPEHLIIKEVGKHLNDHKNHESPADQEIRNRIDFCLEILLLYAEAFKTIRAHPEVIFNKEYAYGM